VQAWGTLRVLAAQNGTVRVAGDSQQWAVLEKRIQEIRKKFKTYFRLTEDPIRFIQKTFKAQDKFGYCTKFKISALSRNVKISHPTPPFGVSGFLP